MFKNEMRQLSIGVIVVIGLLTAWLGYHASRVEFDYDFEKFFPSEDEETGFFNEYRETFGTDNDFVLFGIENRAGIYDVSFIQKVKQFQAEIDSLPQITDVASLLNYAYPIKSGISRQVFMVPVFHVDEPERWREDSVKIAKDSLLQGTLVATDMSSLCLYANTRPYLSKAGSDSLAKAVDEIRSRNDFDQLHIAGRSTGQSYYVELMQSELAFFALTSFLLVLFFLAVTFRTFWGVWVPVIVVVFSAIWIVGFMHVINEPINLVLTILPTIIFVVGMSDVVHIVSRYMEELRKGLSKMDAVIISFKEVALATFLTSLTTAIGFLTLMTSPIEPVREFGIYTAIGVMFAYILAYTIMPAMMVLMPEPKLVVKKNKSVWKDRLDALYNWVMRYQKTILISSLVLTLLSIWSVNKIPLNNFLLEDLKEGNVQKEQFRFFEAHYSGVRPFEMAIRYESEELLEDPRFYAQMEKLENYLINEYKVGFMISPARLIRNINKWFNGKNEIPADPDELKKILKTVKKSGKDKGWKHYVSEEKKMLRIAGKVGDLGSVHFREQNQKLDEYFKKEFANAGFRYQLTGTAHLIDKNNYMVSSGLIKGLLISFAVIAFIFGLLYRSWKMVLIGLVPNILPLLLIGLVMYLLQVDLKVSTSMFFTIAFGIAVDDTIHFLSKFRMELAKGADKEEALKTTFQLTGKAIILTTVVLSGGFLTLVFSDFLGTFYLGLLVSITLVLAVLCDLLLLPVLIRRYF